MGQLLPCLNLLCGPAIGMKMTITRQAVCAADDQLNDLEMHIVISCDTTIESCVAYVEHAKFLQFSSTHSCATGYLNDQAVVRLFATAKPEYLINPAFPVAAAREEQQLSFRFV
jgi:hypothetical protein